MTKKVDRLIIGAGPAGCALATPLDDGKETLIVDMNAFPRDKPCSGLLVEETYNALKTIGIPDKVYGQPKYLPLRHIDVDNNINVLHKRGLGNVNRMKFDHWLQEEIGNKAEIWDKTAVTRIKPGKTIAVTVRKDNETLEIEAQTVIGADGAVSVTRRELGFKPAFQYHAAQDFIRYEEPLDDCKFIYWNALTDWYLWIVPKSNGIIETGGALLPGTDRDKVLARMREKMGIDGEIVEKKNWRLSQPRKLEDIKLGNGNNIFLAGEAAGFISPSTGEGISFGLRSGQLLAKALESKNPGTEYAKLTQPLLQEVMEKHRKASALSNPKLRAELLLKIAK